MLAIDIDQSSSLAGISLSTHERVPFYDFYFMITIKPKHCSIKKKFDVFFFFSNIIGLLERKNKRKSVLEITKMYYFKI